MQLTCQDLPMGVHEYDLPVAVVKPRMLRKFITVSLIKHINTELEARTPGSPV